MKYCLPSQSRAAPTRTSLNFDCRKSAVKTCKRQRKLTKHRNLSGGYQIDIYPIPQVTSSIRKIERRIKQNKMEKSEWEK